MNMSARILVPLMATFTLVSCDKNAEDVQGDLVGAPHANTVVAISMSYTHNGAPFDTSIAFTDAAGTPIKIDALRFYISKVSFTDDAGDSVAAFPDKYLLIDVNQGGTIRNIGEVDGHLHEMHFGLGVDSVTNHADPVTLGAPLNAPGMWWTWAAGFMFLSLEGRYDSNGNGVVDDTPGVDNEFLYHCGMDTLYTPVTLHVHTDANQGGDLALPIDLNIDTLLAGMDIVAHPVIQDVTPITRDLMLRLAAGLSHVE